MNTILTNLRQDLIAHADPVWKSGAERYFKEPVRFYGMSNSIARGIGREYYKQLKGFSKNDILALCEELMETGLMEETIIACDWSNRQHRLFEPGDFATFERWISKYVNNWAACDTLCNHTVAECALKYPVHLADLKRFTDSKNRWVRRAAAVTLIIPAPRGLFLEDILEIATRLLHDPDDLVQKGYGWMLKAAAEAHRHEIFKFVMQHKATMPRTALRYAIEKMPAEMRTEAMKKPASTNRK